MKLLVKMTIVICFLLISAYYLYFYISPSITVINKSDHIITEVNVKLPKSRLSFGSIELGQMNTIYYSLKQNDGSYHYSFKLAGKIITGTCGYLTSHEFNKRFEITVSKSNQILCKE